MQVELSKIHAAPQPIRETWDEEKMQGLTASIRDLGVIVPIKVRPNSDGYEVVYGHRRAEAARRAGLSHISAEIEGMDDGASVKQAIAENVVREDMEPLELGKAMARLRDEYAMTNVQIAAAFGMSKARVSEYITLATDPIMNYVNNRTFDHLHNIQGVEKKAMVTRQLGSVEDRIKVLEAVGDKHYSAVASVTDAIRPLPQEARQAVLEKAKRERLESEHIERVAAVVFQAIKDDKPSLRESAMAIRGDAVMYTDMVQQRAGMLNFIERKEDAQKKKKQAEVQDYDELVKEGINYIRMLFTWMTDYAYEGIEQGKFSPEAARYVLRRFDSLVDEYDKNLRPSLDQIKE